MVSSQLARFTTLPRTKHKETVRADSINPESDVSAAFSNRLKQMGIAQPNPTFSPSSTATAGPDTAQAMPESAYPSASNNTTLSVLEARQRLQDKADNEFDHTGRSSDKGREFLDVATIRDILALRARGVDSAAIESRLRLKTGVVKRLGPPGMVAALGVD